MQNKQDIRVALERFTYGFPVVTVKDGPTDFLGTLATSFYSLPEDPFQVVLSLGPYVNDFPAYRRSNYFAVNLLSAEQESLAGHFSYRPVEHFDGIDCELGQGDTPMLRGCALRIECKVQYFYQLGGEFICVGKVMTYDSSGLAELRALEYNADK